MVLIKYFKQERHHDCLPDLRGPLNKQVPSGGRSEEADTVCYKATNTKKNYSALFRKTSPNTGVHIVLYT